MRRWALLLLPLLLLIIVRSAAGDDDEIHVPPLTCDHAPEDEPKVEEPPELPPFRPDFFDEEHLAEYPVRLTLGFYCAPDGHRFAVPPAIVCLGSLIHTLDSCPNRYWT